MPVIVATNPNTGNTYQWPKLDTLKRWMTGDTTITPQPVTAQVDDGGVLYVPCTDTPPPAHDERANTWHIIPTYRGRHGRYVRPGGHIRVIRPGAHAGPIIRHQLMIRLENGYEDRLPYDRLNSALYKAQEAVAARAVLDNGDRFRVLCERRHGRWEATAFWETNNEYGGLWSRDRLYESAWYPHPDDGGDPVVGETIAGLLEAVNVRAETVAYVVVA